MSWARATGVIAYDMIHFADSDSVARGSAVRVVVVHHGKSSQIDSSKVCKDLT